MSSFTPNGPWHLNLNWRKCVACGAKATRQTLSSEPLFYSCDDDVL